MIKRANVNYCKTLIRKYANVSLTDDEKLKLHTLTNIVEKYKDAKIYNLDANKDIALLLAKYMDKKAPFRLRHPTIAGIPNKILGGLGTAAILAPQMFLPTPIAFAPLFTGETLNNRAEAKAVQKVYDDYKKSISQKNFIPEGEKPPIEKEDLKWLMKLTKNALK